MTPLFPTAYLPPIRYVAAMMRHSAVLVEAKETFPRQTYRNRAEIMTAGGVRALSVPVVRGNHTPVDQVGIDYKERWNTVHLRTIAAAYSASPYYFYYRDELEALLARRYERLVELNQALLAWLLSCLKIGCTIAYTTDWQPPVGVGLDYRNAFSPKRKPVHETLSPYYQVFADRQPFAPDLSVIDLLFNLGPEAADYLRTNSIPDDPR